MITLSELAVIALTVALAHLALSGYLILKKGPQTRSIYLLLSYLLAAGGWNLLILAHETQRLKPFWGFDWVAVIVYPLPLLALFLWLFTVTFLDWPGLKLWGYFAGGLTLALMIGLDFGLLPPSLAGAIPVGRIPLLFGLAGLAMALNLGHAFWITMKTQRTMYSPRHRNRIQFLQLSLLIMAAGMALYLSQILLAREIGLLTYWLGALILTYLTVNQNLADIKSSFKELVSLLIVALFTFVIYSITIYWLEVWFTGSPSRRVRTALIAAILLTVFYPPLHGLVKSSVGRFFFRHQYNYTQIIKAYIQTVNNILLVEDLTSICLSFIEKNLKIKRGAFFILRSQDKTHLHFRIMSNLGDELPPAIDLLKDSPLTQRLVNAGLSVSQYSLDIFPEFRLGDETGVKDLKVMSFEQFIPIKRNNVLIAILAVGPFDSGVPYSLEDVELLSTLADQTAIALENARLFKNVRYNLEEITRINDLMDNIFASIESAVITVDPNNQITTLNQAAYHILNLPKTIEAGSNVSLVLERLKSTPLPALLRDVRATRRSYHAYEIVQEIPERGIVSFSVDLTPIKNTQKQIQGVAIVINDFTETRRLQVVQNLFRKYLSPAVVDRLPDDPTQLKLGGQRQEVTILFADIRGFSTFSEHQDPEDLINVLNKYLSMAAESILAYEGTLDKFMGDAVMAIFNAPLSQPDHTLRAVKAALRMQKAILEFHQGLGEYTPMLHFGVGIHVGEAVIGNVGTQARMDYTAVGDAVNLAKRIQENTPGGRILLSQRTYDCVQDKVNAVPYKELTVKGRQTPEQTYELIGDL